jgi:hypothetical protein
MSCMWGSQQKSLVKFWSLVLKQKIGKYFCKIIEKKNVKKDANCHCGSDMAAAAR